MGRKVIFNNITGSIMLCDSSSKMNPKLTAKPTPKTPAQVKTNNVAQKNATAHLSKLKK